MAFTTESPNTVQFPNTATESCQDEYRFVYYNHTNHALRLSNQAWLGTDFTESSYDGVGSAVSIVSLIVWPPVLQLP